jgi:hypothetical protein
MPAQHAGDKPGGAVFTADVGIRRRGGAGEPEDKGEIFFLAEFLAQVGLTFLKSAITA